MVGSGGADRRRGGRGHDRAGRRGVDRAAGRLEDGARRRGVVRREDPPEAVRLARVLPRLLPRSRRPPSAALDAEPRSARAPRVHGLARLLRPRRDLPQRPARLPRARVPARPRVCGSASADADRRSRPSGRPGCSLRRPCSSSGFASGSTSRRREVSSTSGSPASSARAGSSTARRRTGTCRSAGTSSRAGRRTRRARCASASRRTGAARRRSSAATPTDRSRTSPTCPRRRSSGGAGSGTRCRRRTPRRSRSTCSRSSGSSSSGSGSEESRLAALLGFGWAAYPFTAYTLNANTNDAIMPAFLLLGFWLVTSDWARGASGRACGLDEVRRAPRRAAVGDVSGARAPPRAPVRRRVSRGDRRRLRDPPARAVALGRDADVLGADDRVPGGAQFTVLDLGLGPVPRRGDPRPRLPAARRRRPRRRARARRRVRPETQGPGRARGAHGRGARRLPAHADPLVLPLPPVGRPVRAALAAAPAAGRLRRRRRGRPRSRTPYPSRGRTRPARPRS